MKGNKSILINLKINDVYSIFSKLINNTTMINITSNKRMWLKDLHRDHIKNQNN